MTGPSGTRTLAAGASITASCEQLDAPGACGICDSSGCAGPTNPPQTDTYSCTTISSSTTPTRGQSVTYTCTGSGNVASYANFRVLLNSTPLTNTGANSVILNSSQQAQWTYAIPTNAPAGNYLVQCQICNTSNQCTTWGAAQ